MLDTYILLPSVPGLDDKWEALLYTHKVKSRRRIGLSYLRGQNILRYRRNAFKLYFTLYIRTQFFVDIFNAIKIPVYLISVYF